jgi:hypothetical protein
MQIRSIFYGLWFGSIIGGILVAMVRSMFFGHEMWLNISLTMRITVIYVFPFVVAASFTLLPLLIRHSKVHFVGFTYAGAVAGIVVSALYLFVNRVLNWFTEASTTTMTFVFLSAVIVAWSIWAVSRVAELISLRRGATR